MLLLVLSLISSAVIIGNRLLYDNYYPMPVFVSPLDRGARRGGVSSAHFPTKNSGNGFMPETEYAPQLGENKRVNDFARGPQRQSVMDRVGDGRRSICLVEIMIMYPDPVGSAELFIGETVRRVPDGEPGLPSERNAEQAESIVNDSSRGHSDGLRCDDAKMELRRSDPFEV